MILPASSPFCRGIALSPKGEAEVSLLRPALNEVRAPLEANPVPRHQAPRSEKNRFRMPAGESVRALAGVAKSVLAIPS
jgi:hypothetical protein